MCSRSTGSRVAPSGGSSRRSRSFTVIALVGQVGAARAALPPPVQPSPEPADVESEYRAFAEEQGRSGDATELVCRALAEQVELCFTWMDGTTRRYVTRSQLAAWGEDPSTVAKRAMDAANQAWQGQRATPRTVEGMKGTYWVSARGDGLDGAGLLEHDRLVAIAGAEPVVAVPAHGTLLFWVPGDADFDKVMAVGVRRIYDASNHPVSPLIYRWQDGEWKVWGQARKVQNPDG